MASTTKKQAAARKPVAKKRAAKKASKRPARKPAAKKRARKKVAAKRAPRKKAAGAKKTVTRSPALEELVLERVASGMSLREACRGDDTPTSQTVRYWAVTDPVFGQRLQVARMVQAHELIDSIREELDRPAEVYEDEDGKKHVLHGELQLRRLRVDSYKWILARALPKLYGDRMTLAGDPEAPLGRMSNDEMLQEVMGLLAVAKKRQLADKRKRKKK